MSLELEMASISQIEPTDTDTDMSEVTEGNSNSASVADIVEVGGPRKSIRQRRRSSVLSDSWDNGDEDKSGTGGQNSSDIVDISVILSSMDDVKNKKPLGHQDQQKLGNKRPKLDIENGSVSSTSFASVEMKKMSSDEEERGTAPPFLALNGDKAPSDYELIQNKRKSSCLCLADVDIFLAKDNMDVNLLRCQAKDGKKVACLEFSSDLKFYRVAECQYFQLLCPSHVKRLRQHSCCPFCGVFCQREKYPDNGVLCCQQECAPTPRSSVSGTGHLFHADCAVAEYGTNILSCPHCNAVGRLPVKGEHVFVSSFPSGNIDLDECEIISSLKQQEEKGWVVLPFEEEAAGVEIEVQRFLAVKNKPPSNTLPATDTITATLRNTSLRATLKLVKAMMEDYDIKSVVSLLEDGADVNHRISDAEGLTFLMKAVELKDLNLVHVLCRGKANPNQADNSGCTPLMLAGVLNQPEIVRYLLAIGADPELKVNKNGMTALHGMAKEDSIDAVRALDLPKRRQLILSKDVDELNPLMTAARFGAHRVVTYLAGLLSRFSLEKFVIAKDKYGGSVLHWGAFGGNLDVLTALVNLGADPNAQDNDGNTPLHVLLTTNIMRRPHIVQRSQALLTAGASYDLTNNSGKSALDFCDPDLKNQLTTWCGRLWNFKKVQKDAGSSLELATILSTRGNNFFSQDLSGGREKRFSIPCVNNVDSSTLQHGKDFFYITEPLGTSYSSMNSIQVENMHRCLCSGKCWDQPTCSCSSLSPRHRGVHYPRGTAGFEAVELYYNSEGLLDLPQKGLTAPLDSLVLYECNELCACDVGECQNRRVQNGLGQMLQVFRTDNGKGWGVRSVRPIRCGDFVMELVGENVLEHLVTNKDFLYEFKVDAKSRIYVDCGKYGNVARFLNHSCDPNLFPVKVFLNSLIPKICFFALHDILPGHELNFDYTILHCLASVVEKVKKLSFHCKCNTAKCVSLNV